MPKPYSLVSLGLALSEKQTPQIVEKIEKPKDQMEGLESSFVRRRQTLYPTELRRITYVDSKSFIAGDDTVLEAFSLCRKGRRSIHQPDASARNLGDASSCSR